VGANPGLDLESTPVREARIEDHHVEQAALECSQRRGLRPRVLDPTPQTLESLAHEERMRGVVFDEKNSR
jgi:hypothetical protein